MQQLRLKAGAVTNGQAGADVNHLDWGGFTPLHISAKHNNVEIAKVLLAYGANQTLLSTNGERAKEVGLFDVL